MISCKFSKSYLRNILIFGIILLIIGFGNFIINNSLWISLAWVMIGVLSILRYLTIKNQDYLIIDNNKLTVNWNFHSIVYSLVELKALIEHNNKMTLVFKDSKKNIQTWFADDKIMDIKDCLKQISL